MPYQNIEIAFLKGKIEQLNFLECKIRSNFTFTTSTITFDLFVLLFDSYRILTWNSRQPSRIAELRESKSADTNAAANGFSKSRLQHHGKARLCTQYNILENKFFVVSVNFVNCSVTLN